MPGVILTCQVQDASKQEAGFRTHGDVFRTYTLQAPVQYTISGNEVAICMEPADLDAFKRSMDSPATAEAMAFDGVKRETVKMFILDKDVKVQEFEILRREYARTLCDLCRIDPP